MVAICLYMLWGYKAANAQSTSTQTTTNLPSATDVARGAERISLDIDVSLESNLRDTNDANYETSSYLDVTSSYKLFSKALIRANLALQQKLYSDKKTSITNTTITIARDPVQIADLRLLNISAFSILPTNEDDRLKNTFRGGLGLAAGLTQKYNVLRQPGYINYSLSLLQNFHELERTNTNVANLENRIRHTTTLGQQITRDISMGFLAHYQTGKTYQRAFRSSFLITEEITYEVSKSGQIYLAHSNGDNALSANGLDSNISVYDEGTSTFSTGLRVNY